MNVAATKIRHLSIPLAYLRKGFSCFVCLILLFGSTFTRAGSESSGAAEYAVKTAYIYNILRFIHWDENAPLAQTESLNVCLYRNNPFGRYLEPLQNKSIGNKKINIKTINDFPAALSCHLIFIDDALDTETIKQQLNSSDSILLGNNIEFIKNGGLFGLYIENNKVKLGANKNAITESRLHISSQLIEVSQLFGEPQ